MLIPFTGRARKILSTMCVAMPITMIMSCLANSEQASAKQPSHQVGCKMTAVNKSAAMIGAVLNDVDSTYLEVGGGGISDIKQTRTNIFTVSISQEERIDQFTYEIAIDNECNVKILKKESATVSFNH